MKKLASILAAATLAACGQQAEDPADQYRKALPTSNTLTIQAASTSATTAAPVRGLSVPGRAVTADGKADLAVTSYVFATSVNYGVASMLWLIHSITWWPATSCDDHSCTWGPGSSATDVNVFKLVVTKSGEDFHYVLSAAPKSTGGTDFRPIVIGDARRSPVEHRGDGQFTVKFENSGELQELAGQERTDWGTLDVRYDTWNALKNEVVFWNVRDEEANAPGDATNRLNAYFNFDASRPNGELLVAWEPLYGNERVLSLFTQWKTEGGRADLSYYETDGVNTFNHVESECWDGAPDYAQTYDNFDLAAGVPIDPADPLYGDPDACVFAAAHHGAPTLPAPLYPPTP
jgi:hypothetical protein